MSKVAEQAVKKIREIAFPARLMGDDFAPWFEDDAEPIIDAAIQKSVAEISKLAPTATQDESLCGLVLANTKLYEEVRRLRDALESIRQVLDKAKPCEHGTYAGKIAGIVIEALEDVKL